MILRQELVSYIHNLLDCDSFSDYAPNGLQVEGADVIRSIATAVTASADAINTSVALNADALLVHHGYFWKGEESVITGIKRQRIGALILSNSNLLAYHLPLDCHPLLGNNACLGQLFAAEAIKSHRAGKTDNLLWSGSLPIQYNPREFSSFLAEQFKRLPLAIIANDKPIRRIAWCSGGAQDFIDDAAALGVDAYISGEVSERTFYQAKELGIHYFACGHHATERYGIEALGHHLANHFGLQHHFIDSDNPV